MLKSLNILKLPGKANFASALFFRVPLTILQLLFLWEPLSTVCLLHLKGKFQLALSPQLFFHLTAKEIWASAKPGNTFFLAATN